MRVLVTGGTGLVGSAIARRCAQRGDAVRALVRDVERASAQLPGAELVRGDITDPESLRAAVEGVELVFHAAGMPEQWVPDEAIFDRVNREGTRNVLEAALEAKVRRVVYTSTMDVFAAPPGGTFDESRIDPEPKHTAYERSKQAAEREAERVRSRGLDVVYVNPAGVYGPGPAHVALNAFFVRMLRREVPVLPPGGLSVVYVDGCTYVHLAAAERGRSGERYLAADTFVTMDELARAIVREAGLPRVPWTAPRAVLRAVAALNAPIANALKRPPLIAQGELTFLSWGARADSGCAQRELDFVPCPLEEGVRRTVAYLRAEGLA